MGDTRKAGDAEVPVRHLSGEVRVAAQIIDYLSSGLYATPGLGTRCRCR